MRKLFVFTTLIMSVSSAFADESSSQSLRPQLDIAKVVSQTVDTDMCGLEPMQLIYKDSKGELHTLDYLIQGSGCSNG
jgi:hypothetical protein